MRGVAALLFCFAVIGWLLAANDPAAPSTRRMANRLREITQKTQVHLSPYMNREKAALLRAHLKQPLPLKDELQARIRLAEELLLTGETTQVLDELHTLETVAEAKLVRNSASLSQKIDELRTLAWFRLGEQENCVLHSGVESCLLPIASAGVHRKQRGSREAIKGLSAFLERHSTDLVGRWLLNIAYMTVGEYPDRVPKLWLIPPNVFDSDYDIGRFPDIAPQLGVNALGLAGGSVTEDFDGDGFIDIMASSSGVRDQLRFFRNNGNGAFTDRTAEAGLLGLTGGLNLVHSDYNNDGQADVLVLRGAWMGSEGKYPNSLLRNNGDGIFEDVTEEAGLLSFHPTQVGAWADVDNDGWIDLFIGNESKTSDPHPSELFRNNGDGTFTDIAAASGVAELGFVKGAAWGDYDNDGKQDLYVSRLGSPNLLFHNEGRRRFREVAKTAGVTEPLNSFATWFWDHDNDGLLDLFVAGFQTQSLGDIAAVYLGLPNGAEQPRLYRNNGNGTFTDVTAGSKLNRAVLIMGANFGDLDNDGFPDLYLGTGEPDYRAVLPNRMFRNAAGKLFQDVTTSGGFGHLQKGHAVSWADIDNDGDQDIYAVIGGAYEGDAFRNVLFRNPGNGNDFLTLILEGTRSNRAGIGARVRISIESPSGRREIFHTAGTGGSFGANSLQIESGLGRSSAVNNVEVRWPSGLVQQFRSLATNSVWRIREGSEEPTRVERK
jgi:hypothetical protein